MEYLPPLVHIVEQNDEGLPLKTILRKRMNLSRTLLAKLKQTEKGIMLNGQRVYTSVIVKSGDKVEIRMEKETSEDILPENIPINVLFEDEYVLVVSKAAGMIVHPTHGHYTGTLANAVLFYWRTKGEMVRFRPIHRLDQHTSGVLAIAKNQFVHQHISEQMKKNQVDKTYIAFVHGCPIPREGTISAPIDRSTDDPHVRAVRADGYPSVTHYETLREYGRASLLRVRLETGRTHQIRVHMKYIGAPLIGDAMYGPDRMDDAARSLHGLIGRHALHAESLSFTHPITRSRMTFEAPWPDDMEQLCNHLANEFVERIKG